MLVALCAKTPLSPSISRHRQDSAQREGALCMALCSDSEGMQLHRATGMAGRATRRGARIDEHLGWLASAPACIVRFPPFFLAGHASASLAS